MRSMKFLISTPLLLIDHDRFIIRMNYSTQFDLFKILAAHLISHVSETDLFNKITLHFEWFLALSHIYDEKWLLS